MKFTNLLIVIALIAVVGFIGGALFVSFVGPFTSSDYNNCKVDGKDRSGGEKASMRVYTENCGVFEIDDSLIRGRWNSSDMYASIDEGKTYNFHTSGWRVPFYSSFPNILEATEVR